MSRQRSQEVIETAEFVTIGELVRLTGIRYSTLKYYTEEGMLQYEQEEENLTRRYKRVETMERIMFIKKMKATGLPIVKIKEMMK
ncbi:MerR family transcriptional regulator [Candidatus Galacturonibacter soehngenii]|uniref:MerR family transcriptional regulator n=1 Tax=Candidatus Galacturonatibacter soehngenii TaxID=2307010 RepID=A0A7V7QNN6_9FIRM|nr:MerR family transcriptional regulator [Candidatus Galacturonibacter soehngenii]KAB1440661.1 MerR family transcriptional regulator [Candidatus Galacturonibacter soehngenii]MBA4688243.1 MerR family transcriptional regulator [Candidatus Galacturonibacter soehngenii]